MSIQNFFQEVLDLTDEIDQAAHVEMGHEISRLNGTNVEPVVDYLSQIYLGHVSTRKIGTAIHLNYTLN